GSGSSCVVRTQLGVTHYPTLILFDDQGHELWRHVGLLTDTKKAELERLIQSRLGGSGVLLFGQTSLSAAAQPVGASAAKLCISNGTARLRRRQTGMECLTHVGLHTPRSCGSQICL